MNRSEQEVVGIQRSLYFHTGREVFANIVEQVGNIADNLGSVRTCRLVNHGAHGVVTVLEVLESVGQTAQLDVGYIFQIENLTVGIGPNDHVAKLLGGLQTALVGEHILERLVTLVTELTGGGLDVLLGQHGGYIGRHQSVLCHHVGFEPDTHRVVGSHYVGIAHTRDTLYQRDYVDFGVVLEELEAIPVVGAVKREYHQHTGLSLLGNHTHLRYLGRQQVQGFRHPVLHIHGSHIGVGTLFEIYGDGGRTCVGGGRRHVHHVFHTVDRLLQGSDYTVQDSLGIGTRIGCRDLYRRRCNIGVLRDGQKYKSDKTQYDHEDGNHGRQYRAIDKSV